MLCWTTCAESMTFRVELTADAKQDCDSIIEWLLTHHAGDAGTRWFNALEEAIDSLSQFPRRCPLAPETTAFPVEIRNLLYGHKPHVYRILFAIEGEISLRLTCAPRPTTTVKAITRIFETAHISHSASTSTMTLVRGIFPFSASASMARNTSFSFWRLGDFKMK